MKKLFLIFIALGVLVLGSFVFEANASRENRIQQATMKLDKAISVHGVLLTPGVYTFVHDGDSMARGDACTSIYKGYGAASDKLVVSFHCTPAERTKAKHFLVRSIETPGAGLELREYQFKGDTEAHLVPAP